MARSLLSLRAMVRIPALILLLALPPLAFAALPPGLVPDGPVSKALALAEARRVPEAFRILSSVKPDMATLGSWHYASARAYAAAGKPLEAVSHYRKAAVYAPGAALREIALFSAARDELRMGYHYEAKSDCILFLRKFPDSGRARDVRVMLAESLAGAGRLRDAVRQFEQAGNAPDALYGKANALQRMGMVDEARRAYAAAADADERYPVASEETRYWKGENLRLSGDRASAKGLLLSVTGERFRDAAAIGLGEIARAESRLEEAGRLFETALRGRDKAARRTALLRLADVDAARGKPREAAARLEELVAKHPFTRECDEAMLGMARLRAAAGDGPGALTVLAKLAVRASPVRKDAIDAVEAILLAARGKGPARLAGLWASAGRWVLDPSRERSLAAIADALEGSGGPHLELVRWLARFGSSAVRPRYLVALARLCAGAGDEPGAREAVKGLRAMNASGDEIARVEAGLKLAAKDYRGAAATLLLLRSVEGKDAAMLGETLAHSPNPRRAETLLQAALSRPGADAADMSRLADALYDAGRRADAARYYRMAVEKDPACEWACYRLGSLVGRGGGADDYFKRVKTDPTLARMARAAKKEMELDGR